MAASKGARLLQNPEALVDHPHVGDVRGKGLMCAVELVKDKATKKNLMRLKKLVRST